MAAVSISFSGPQKKARMYKASLLRAMAKTLDSGTFFHGKENESVHTFLAAYFGRDTICLTGSGHDSLLFALRAIGISKEDEVIVPASAYPTAFAVAQIGARVVVADTDRAGQLEGDTLTNAFTPRTKAIILVHMYGFSGRVDDLCKLARKRGITVIEDCAQSFGSRYNKRLLGTFGDIACFSFYPTKNVATFGDGGAVLARSRKHFNFIRAAAQYGERTRYKSTFVSGHSRMAELQASVLSVYLKDFLREEQKRKLVYARYRKAFQRIGIEQYVEHFTYPKTCDPVPNVFPLLVKRRSKLRTYLKSRGIETLIHYPLPVHLVPAFRNLGYKRGDFPAAEYIASHQLSLPLHTFLTVRQVEYAARTVGEFYSNRNMR